MDFFLKEKEYLLDRAGVDKISAEISTWMKQTGVGSDTRLRLRLTMEEILFRVCEHYGGNIRGTLRVRRRFGTPVLQFRYPGEAFDPVHMTDDAADEAIAQLLETIGMMPGWNWRSGMNAITLRAPVKTMHTELRLVFAVVLAVLAGAAGAAIPGSVRSGLMEYLLSPVSEAFMHALHTFVGVMIFLTVLSGICSIGSISDFSRMGRYVITRLVSHTFAAVAFCTVVMIPFFRFGTGPSGSVQSQAGAVVDLVFSVIPSNPVTPFTEGNMMQIIFMAAVIGFSLLILGDKAEKIRSLLDQACLLFQRIIEMVCRFLPLYVFTSITMLLWQNGPGIFVRLWKPVLLTAGLCIVLMAGKTIYAGIRLQVPVKLLFAKMRETVLQGFITASSSATFGKMLDVNEKKLGIAQGYDHFALPFGNLLTGSASGAGLVITIYYLAEHFDVPVNIGWFITVWIMCSVFSMAMPPVSGGMLVCMGLLMAQLNVPSVGLAAAGILGIILDFITTGSKIAITHMELLLQAEHLKLMDRAVLEASIR